MTALDKFARLETIGKWRPSAEVPLRQVVVAFGDASVVLSDLKGNAILSHWSLPAISRRNPGQHPAIYTPGAEDDGESLELDDQMMIDAIATVQSALARRRPRRGSVRRGVVGGIAAAVLLGAVWLLPNLLVSHTASVLPFVKAQEIGQTLQGAMQRYTGAPCHSEEGSRALDRLAARLFPEGEAKFVVLRDGLPPGSIRELPGRLYLLDHDLVEKREQPEVLAGHLLAAELRAEARDPLVETLDRAGVRSTFTLLATGLLPKVALQDQALAQLRAQGALPATEALLARFAKAKVTATPYALSLPEADAARARLIAEDPLPPTEARPIIADADWLALQSICQR